MPLKQEMAKAKSIALELEKDLIRCIALLAIWNRANDKKDIKSRYNNTYEAHALSIIHDSLHITMIMALMRMYDNDRRSASIPTLIGLLESANLLEELKKNSRPQREHIDKWLDSVKLRYARLKNEQTLKALRRLRNYALAHADIKKASLHGARYGYERKVLERTIPIIELLLLIVHSRDANFSEVRGIWKRYSNYFWGSAAKSPKAY